jgi:hypothetical protein
VSGRGRAAERAQRALLLEVKRAARARPRGHVAGAPSQVGDGGARRRVGQHPQAEGERGRRNVEAPLDGEPGRDRGQVLLGELPVRVTASVRPVPQRRQQPEILPVAEHAGGHAEPRGGLSDAHEYQSNILLSKSAATACARPAGSRSVVVANRASAMTGVSA